MVHLPMASSKVLPVRTASSALIFQEISRIELAMQEGTSAVGDGLMGWPSTVKLRSFRELQMGGRL